ncbi:phosphoenolpyruvate--protein phosphotransferase [Liberibacter crescens]|uniref:phosphoenolpyruvate--protein phosphotransferase n=1 Tax=Liberibacter crescens TaxID=1273132 RepID=UPI003CC77753
MKKLHVEHRDVLKRLRALIVEPLDYQERLNRLVKQIAEDMAFHVCSIYVLSPDGLLELYATEGLNKDAVHKCKLKIGQGLVGNVAAFARSLNTSDGQSHSSFFYLPETGEEMFHGFLGVPILRVGRLHGVLVVQDKDERIYNDDEVEIIETIAMVLAEMIAVHEREVDKSIEQKSLHSVSIDGSPYNGGIGFGNVLLHNPRVFVRNLLNEDPEKEVSRLGQAIGNLRISIDRMLLRGDMLREGEHRDVLESYRMFANDQGWLKKIEEAIRNGLTAEAAVEKVNNDYKVRIMRFNDLHNKERIYDFEDLANRLLRHLIRDDNHSSNSPVPSNAIIFARSMGVAELLDYPNSQIKGLVLEEGTITSHVVIVARAMGIPVVGQVKSAVALAENGDSVIVDGDEGRVYLRPLNAHQHDYVEKVHLQVQLREQLQQLRDVVPITKDGKRITLLINAGLLLDMPHLIESGAEGVGLFRTELQFMLASNLPRVNEQEVFYRSVIRQAKGKKVTFRTLDIGDDKVVPYFHLRKESNPALGWRAIRLTLDRSVLLRTQFRALLRASSGNELRIIIPMVTEVSELRSVREFLRREINNLSKFGYELPVKLQFGAMIEVPVLLWQLDELMTEVDFVSVGSNDLFQFSMAVDRNNPRISERFDFLGRPFLRILRDIVQAGVRNNTHVNLCGEMAGKPICAMALIGIGFRSISMSPASINLVKAMLLNLDVCKLEKLLENELNDQYHSTNMRDILSRFAMNENIPL